MLLSRCLVALMWAVAANAAAALDDALPAPVAAALAKAGLPADALGAIALPPSRWLRPWQYRADVSMQPGSAMKVVTTVVALDRLGPNLRGRTELLVSGAIDGERLEGDLVLKGGADPELDTGALLHLLYQLRQRGVREIGGDLVLDRTLFRPARIDVGLPPFDDAPEWPYNVIPDALMASGNLVRIDLAAGDAGAVRARLTPPLDGVEIDTSALVLTDTACDDWDDDWTLPRAQPSASGPAGSWRVLLQGGFPRRCEAGASLQLLDRDVLNERTVRALWQALGGSWRKPAGSLRLGAAPGGAASVARHEARPWGEVLRQMNKTSDNALTRLLFLQLGLAAMAADAQASTLDLARREAERWFDDKRIDRRGFVIDNGSGLSREERITPRALAQAIRTTLDGPHAPELLMSLPVAGVDGTMRRRLKGTPAEGWARLKTGTLRNVTALAGTVRDSKGGTWVVAAMVNHEEAAKGRAVLDALMAWVAGSGARWR
jgi:serine-type D-Ala-D-Ala carboxypeptidase/endopeptidase (penicillin-binding protein 4)